MKFRFYPFVLITIFSILVLLLFYRVTNLEYKYETLKEANVRLTTNHPLTDEQVKERQFKEEMYIKQQERDTNLILLVFTVALATTAFLTVVPFRREFESRIASVENEYANYSTTTESKYNDLEFKLSLSQSNLFKILYNQALKDKEASLSVVFLIKSISELTHNYLSKSSLNNELLKNNRLEEVRDALREVYNTYSENSIVINEDYKEPTLINLTNLRRLPFTEIDELVSLVHSTIKWS